jgi:hypothetical protein
MSRASHIDAFTSLLREICARGVQDTNDFVNLAITGEELRRGLVASAKQHPHAEEAMAEYAQHLRAARQLAPVGLEADLETALRALVQEPPCCADEAEDIILGIDEVLMVAAACVHAGAMTIDTANTIGIIAAECVAGLSSRLSWAAPLATERNAALGHDPTLPVLYSWLWVVARCH